VVLVAVATVVVGPAIGGRTFTSPVSAVGTFGCISGCTTPADIYKERIEHHELL
jgi:hypothetical protein